MEVDVVDDADKSVKQQANGRCKKPLLKSGQGGIRVHVGTGTVAYRGQVYMGYEFQKAPTLQKLINYIVVSKANLQVSSLMPRGRDIIEGDGR